MADPNETLDPEPVDAEFEPADESRPSDRRARAGAGWLSLVLVFLLASAAGGALGYGASRYLDPSSPLDDGAAAERAALTDAISAVETRLDGIESRAPAAELVARLDRIEAQMARAQAMADPDLSDIESRLAALEDAPAAAGTPFDPSDLERRLDALDDALADAEALSRQALDAAQAGAGSGVDPQILQNLTERLAGLEQAQDTTGPAFDDPAAQIATLERRLAAAEGEIATLRAALDDARALAETASRSAGAADNDAARASRNLAARALALTALRDMADSGEAFEAERAALARLWRNNADLEALAGTARAGVPTLDQLAADYPGAAIRDAAGPDGCFSD